MPSTPVHRPAQIRRITRCESLGMVRQRPMLLLRPVEWEGSKHPGLGQMSKLMRVLGLFIVAALCEIAGAYLIWQWQRTGKSIAVALVGLAALFLYSLIQTTQTFGFGRTFAAYGAIFIYTALLWGWLVDKQVPDQWDVLGAVVCLAGAAIIVVVPRT